MHAFAASVRSVLALFLLSLGTLAAALPIEPLRWTFADAAALLSTIEDARYEGLDPRDYDPATLRRAIERGAPDEINRATTASSLRLASDYLQGHVRGHDRIDWYLQGPVADDATLLALIDAALRRHDVSNALLALLPRHSEYRALRDELQRTSPADALKVQRLRVNLERWRWMPRDLGQRYILVNVPGYSLKLVDQDRVIDERPVIVGKSATPTPQYSATITGVILNPWWEVPKSIVAESVGELLRRTPAKAKAQGYVMVPTANGGVRVRQAPGPRNALGRMKLVMPNPFDVYLHDTPSKGLFERTERALSHGCIRVKGAVEFAALLLEDDPRWNRAQIDRILASRATTKADLARPLPVHVAYFTAATNKDGKPMYFGDPYRRDAPVWRALNDRAEMQIAASETTCPA